MPTTPRIPKEVILEAALQLLIREGYAAVNIKTIAKEIGCSTQPISWHFGNMDGLRRELGEYAYLYADKFTAPTSEVAMDAFTEVGISLINLAFDMPNLYRFLFLDGSSGYCIGGINALTELKDNCEMIQLIAKQNNTTYEKAALYLENMIIYTVGLLSLCVSGVLKADKEEVIQKMLAMNLSLQ